LERFYIKFEDFNIYSVYHEPVISENNTKGVVLCNPIGHEYIRCHRLYLQLAKSLSQKGYHVIRFDYPFTGDSFSSEYDRFDQLNIDICLRSINRVCREFQDNTGITQIFLGGIRFGATTAFLSSINLKPTGLFLWFPVIYGKKYINEIRNEYKKWLNGSFTFEERNKKDTVDIFGFTYSVKLLNELNELNLNSINLSNCKLLLIDNFDFFSKEATDYCFYKAINQSIWIKKEGQRNKSLVPVDELKYIQNWFVV